MPEEGKMTISPLIATVLLIAFSFALGAVVLSWGESFVEARASFVNNPSEVAEGCQALTFAVLAIDGNPVACRSSSGMQVMLDNQGGSISHLQAKLIAQNTVTVIENVLASPLSTGETRKVVVPYTGEDLLQIRFVPQIGTRDLCSSATQVLNTPLPDCAS